jgi:hypothetical protein
MPDGKTHKLVGAGTGAVYAGYRAKEETNLHWWMEVAGGAFGGYLGVRVPMSWNQPFRLGTEGLLTAMPLVVEY